MLLCVHRWSVWNKRWSRKGRSNACWRSNYETPSGHGRMRRTATAFWRRRWRISFPLWGIWPWVQGLVSFDMAGPFSLWPKLSGFIFWVLGVSQGLASSSVHQGVPQKKNKTRKQRSRPYLCTFRTNSKESEIWRRLNSEGCKYQIETDCVVLVRIISNELRAVLTFLRMLEMEHQDKKTKLL